MADEMVNIGGIRYRRDDAERRGLIEMPAVADVSGEVDAKVAERVAQLEQEFEARVTAEVEKRTAAESAKAAEVAEDAKAPKNKAATPATK